MRADAQRVGLKLLSLQTTNKSKTGSCFFCGEQRVLGFGWGVIIGWYYLCLLFGWGSPLLVSFTQHWMDHSRERERANERTENLTGQKNKLMMNGSMCHEQINTE